MTETTIECKLCKSLKRTQATTELPEGITVKGTFAKPDLPTVLCMICDSGDHPTEGALALAVGNHIKRLEDN